MQGVQRYGGALLVVACVATVSLAQSAQAGVKFAKTCHNGTGFPQSGQRIRLEGTPVGVRQDSNRFTSVSAATDFSLGSPAEMLFYFGSPLPDGGDVDIKYSTANDDFDPTEWVWLSENSGGAIETPVADPGFKFEGFTSGGEFPTRTVKITLHNRTKYAEQITGGRCSLGGDPGLDSIDIAGRQRGGYGPGESGISTKPDIAGAFNVAAGGSQSFTVQMPSDGRSNFGPNGPHVFFRARLYLLSDTKKKNPVDLVVWCNPFQPKPAAALSNWCHSECGLGTAYGHTYAGASTYVQAIDTKNPYGSLPNLSLVSITPLSGNATDVIFTSSSQAANVYGFDDYGRRATGLYVLNVWLRWDEGTPRAYRFRFKATGVSGTTFEEYILWL